MNTYKPPKALEVTASVLHLLAGFFMLVIILLTVADVVSRKLWDRSILGAVDITTVLLVGVAFLGLASAEMAGRHVSVDLVESHVSKPKRVIFAIARLVLLVIIGAILLWGLGEVLESAISRHETTNDILRLPTWPAKLALFVAFLCFFAIAIVKAIAEVRYLREHGDEPELPPSVVAAQAQAIEMHDFEEGTR